MKRASSPTDHIQVQGGHGGATVALQTQHDDSTVFSHTSGRIFTQICKCDLICVTCEKIHSMCEWVELGHLLSTSEVLSAARSTLVLSSSMTSAPSLYQVTLGGGFPLKGILTAAV